MATPEPGSAAAPEEPAAGAAAPEESAAGTATTTTTTRAVANRLTAAKKLLEKASAKLEKLQQKLTEADAEILASQKSRAQAQAMCQLFDWSRAGFDVILAKPWNNRDLLQKQAGVIAYMFEAMYDVLLAPAANVSRSPGFEHFSAKVGSTASHRGTKRAVHM